MHSDDGKDLGMLFSKFHGAAAACDPCADGDDAGDPGLGRPGKDGVKVPCKIRSVEVGVGVDEHKGGFYVLRIKF